MSSHLPPRQASGELPVSRDDTPVDPKDLIAEKRMWQVFKASLKLPPSRFNVIWTLVSIGVFSVDAALSYERYQLNAEFIREFSRIGLATGLSVIAFFIAGFAVFASMTERSLFMAKAVIREPKSGLSFLKRDMFAVMGFYGYLLGYIGLCAVFVFVSRKGGLVYSCIDAVGFGEFTRSLVVSFAYVVLCSSSVFVLLQIKSFIYNVYHLMMSSILWGFEEPKDKGGGGN